ncbi:MAG: MYG1 family protein [Candidatus Ancillula sp.]|jgi:uncharacterized UPF0160 family protein|nr:MYG1 family protein [Candidatus Ancillula sp.]
MTNCSIKTAVTHNGTFHGDDVFGSALLKLLYPDIQIIRTRDDKIIKETDLAFDVGRIYDPKKLRFDHHQETAPLRENGIKYSGFGLLWKTFGLNACRGNQEVADKIDQKLVQQIDGPDNGQEVFKDYNYNLGASPYQIYGLIAKFNPEVEYGKNKDSNQIDIEFFKAVDFAKTILSLLIDREIIVSENKNKLIQDVKKSENPNYYISNFTIDIDDIADMFPDLIYSITYNSVADNWKIYAIHNSNAKFKPRKPFPDEWCGKSESELNSLIGIEDAVFCHINGFLLVTKSKESAIKAAELSLKM